MLKLLRVSWWCNLRKERDEDEPSGNTELDSERKELLSLKKKKERKKRWKELKRQGKQSIEEIERVIDK